jgi:hypothetical protein
MPGHVMPRTDKYHVDLVKLFGCSWIEEAFVRQVQKRLQVCMFACLDATFLADVLAAASLHTTHMKGSVQ